MNFMSGLGSEKCRGLIWGLMNFGVWSGPEEPKDLRNLMIWFGV